MSNSFSFTEPLITQKKQQMDFAIKQRGIQSKKVDIFEACINGKIEAIMSRFPNPGSQNPGIDQKDQHQLTLLHYAVRYNHQSIVQYLLKCGAKVNITGGQEKLTPMHLAARYKACPTLLQHRKIHYDVHGKRVENISQSVSRHSTGQKPKHMKSLREYAYDSSGALMPFAGTDNEKSVESLQLPTYNQQTIIGLLVQEGGNLNALDNNMSTPLHYAVMRRNVSAVIEILSYDTSSVKMKDRYLFTPLHYAAEQGSVQIAKILIDKDAEIDAVNNFQMTPLHVACEEGHPEVSDLLLKELINDKRCDIDKYINYKDQNNYTALHYAAISGDETLMSLLLQYNPECIFSDTHNSNTPLHLACSAGYVGNVMKLVNREPKLVNEINANRETPLHIASGLNRIDIVRFLINEKANIHGVDKDMESPLFFAIRRDNVEIVRLLIENGANLCAKNIDEQTVLHVAAINDCTDCVEYLSNLEYFDTLQNSWDSHENRPIHLAVWYNQVEMVKLLCRYEAPLDSKNDVGFTPLLIAASQGHIEIIKMLLEINLPLALDEDDANNNALHLAAENGHFIAIPILFEAGISIESRNIYKQTALDVACEKGNIKVVQSLIDCEARINISEMSKSTPPLLIAARYGHADIVSLLIIKGADVNRLDESNRNCIDIAIDENRRETVIAILNTPKWADVLRHVSIFNGKNTTPLRRMIETMPDAAELVLDKCLTNNGLPRNHRDYKIYCNYEFLEDLYTPWGSSLNDLKEESFCWKPLNIFHSFIHKLNKFYDKFKFKSRNNSHPLSMIVHRERSSLIGHPLVRYLVRKKWNMYPFYIYLIRLIFLIITIFMFTGNCITSASAPYQCINSNSGSNFVPIISDPGYVLNLTECLRCPYIPPDDTFQSIFFVSIGKFIILLLSMVSSFILIFYIMINLSNLFSIQVILELSSYVLAFVYILGFFTWSDGTPIEPLLLYRCTNAFRSIGALGLCLMWLSFVLFLGKVPKVGIYVVMYTDIFRTFFQFVPVYFMLVFSFAIPFYMLFLDRYEVNSYTNPMKAIMKTLVATVGEIEYDTFYNTKTEPPLNIAYFILFLFVLTNSIILMNLLVGLAVDDIQGVQSQAFLKRVGLQVKSCMELEAFFTNKHSNHTTSFEETIEPNDRKRPYIWSFWVFKSNPFADNASQSENICENMSKSFREIKDSIRSLKHQIRSVNDRSQKLETMLEELIRRLPE